MNADVDELKASLSAVADPAVKAWFDNYLKGAIEYRGVKTPVVTKLVKEWAKRHDLTARPEADQLVLVDALLREPLAEDKFAGTIYLQTFMKKADPTAILDVLERSLSRGDFFDWSSTDWLCVRVIDPLIIRHGMKVASRVASWATAANLWHRRASIVPFRHATADAAFRPMIEQIIDTLIVDDARFIQTGIGWVIADWSRHDPVGAANLVETHFDQLSREVIDRHTKHLADHKDYKARKRQPR